MIIADSFMKNGKCYAAFTGPELTKDTEITKIKVNSDVYDVLQLEIKESFSGFLMGMMQVNSTAPLPLAQFSIVNKAAA